MNPSRGITYPPSVWSQAWFWGWASSVAYTWLSTQHCKRKAFVRNIKTRIRRQSKCQLGGNASLPRSPSPSPSPSLSLPLLLSVLQWSWKEVIRQSCLLAQRFSDFTYLCCWDSTKPNHQLPFLTTQSQEARDQSSHSLVGGEKRKEGGRDGGSEGWRGRERGRGSEGVTRLQPPSLFTFTHP